MTDTAALVCWAVAGLGLVMVLASAISRGTKRLLRMSDETVSDPWFRRNDTSGLSLALGWKRPGLLLLVTAASLALVLQAIA